MSTLTNVLFSLIILNVLIQIFFNEPFCNPNLDIVDNFGSFHVGVFWRCPYFQYDFANFFKGIKLYLSTFSQIYGIGLYLANISKSFVIKQSKFSKIIEKRPSPTH